MITKKSRGFGFVNFLHFKDQEEAIKNLHNTVILKNKIKVYSKLKF